LGGEVLIEPHPIQIIDRVDRGIWSRSRRARAGIWRCGHVITVSPGT